MQICVKSKPVATSIAHVGKQVWTTRATTLDVRSEFRTRLRVVN